MLQLKDRLTNLIKKSNFYMQGKIAYSEIENKLDRDIGVLVTAIVKKIKKRKGNKNVSI